VTAWRPGIHDPPAFPNSPPLRGTDWVGGGSVNFTVTFSEPISGVTPPTFTTVVQVLRPPAHLVQASQAQFTASRSMGYRKWSARLNLVSDGIIHDALGTRSSTASFSNLRSSQTNHAGIWLNGIQTADFNGTAGSTSSRPVSFAVLFYSWEMAMVRLAPRSL